MNQAIDSITLLVREYDEAIAYYRDCLGFKLLEDTHLGADKRWVLIAPPGGGTALLLARAANERQAARVGDQTGGRVFLFLRTDDFQRDYDSMKSRGVKFAEFPRQESYGMVAVFTDLYGNKWDFVQHTAPTSKKDGATPDNHSSRE